MADIGDKSAKTQHLEADRFLGWRRGITRQINQYYPCNRIECDKNAIIGFLCRCRHRQSIYQATGRYSGT